MKLKSLMVMSLALAAMPALVSAQYPSQGVKLLSRIPLSQFQGNPSSGAAVFGYTSPSGKEYAIMCVRTGKSVVDISNPAQPRIVGHITGPTSLWHEVTAYNGYAYGATEGGGGMQVMDLTRVDEDVVSLATTFTGGGLGNIHTIQINPASNTVYASGSNLGLAMINVSNPRSPVLVGRWTGRYVHDVIALTYTSGPLQGREVVYCFCIFDGRLVVLDTTNKAAPVVLADIPYQNGNGPHSGSLSDDLQTLFLNDELDGINNTRVFDVSDPRTPRMIGSFTNGLNVIDHNSWQRNGFFFLAQYRAGLRVFDVRNIASVRETGFCDTYPSSDGQDYSGDWGVYAGFSSGIVLASDMQSGLFVFDTSEAEGLGARPLSINYDRGSLVSGSVGNLRKSDDVALDSLSGPEPAASEPDNVRFVVGYETTYSPAVALKITAEGRITDFQSGEVTLQLRNWNTNQFETVGQFNVSQADQTFTLDRVPNSNYVNSSGRIDMRVKTTVTAFSLRPRFHAIFDQLKVEVLRS